MATRRSGVLRAGAEHHRSGAAPVACHPVSFLFAELLRPKTREQDGGDRRRLKAKASLPPNDPEPQTLLLSEKQGRMQKPRQRAEERAAAAVSRGVRKMARGGSEADAVWDPGES